MFNHPQNKPNHKKNTKKIQLKTHPKPNKNQNQQKIQPTKPQTKYKPNHINPTNQPLTMKKRVIHIFLDK